MYRVVGILYPELNGQEEGTQVRLGCDSSKKYYTNKEYCEEYYKKRFIAVILLIF